MSQSPKEQSEQVSATTLDSSVENSSKNPGEPNPSSLSAPPPPPPPTSNAPRPFSPPPIDSSVASPPEPTVGSLSPSATDRVFPIRSVISVDPTPTPFSRANTGDYFHPYSSTNDPRIIGDRRRQSVSSSTSRTSHGSERLQGPANISSELADSRRGSTRPQQAEGSKPGASRLPANVFTDIIHGGSGDGAEGNVSRPPSERPPSTGPASSIKSAYSAQADLGGLVTHRFKHVTTEDGHAVITGRDGETLQRCEDEPIHIPGAIQGFGLLIAIQEDPGGSGNLPVRIVSENSKRIIGRTPKELFELDSFTDILTEEQADNLLDHIDFIRDEDSDVVKNGPEVFTMSIKIPNNTRSRKLWCAIHMNHTNPGLIICEFEMEDDPVNPLVPPNESTPELPEDTLSSNPTEEEYLESTEIQSRPLRVLRSARKRKGEAAAMEVFNIMSQVQEQLAAAPNLEKFLKVLVGVVKELTGFHRVMIYQFDQSYNGRVVTELVDPRATKDLYKGLNFPASDIPKQARDLYRLNRVRMLYDRDQETARLVCRTHADLETPLDLSFAYLRAMSPIHLKYLGNMAVRSSMSISMDAFNELWGLIACHSYGQKGMRVSFPIRKMCRLVGDSASRNIERLSYASRLQARKLINTAPSQHNPSGYIIASSDDLLKLFDADFGLLSIRDETKILGDLEQSQEALAMLEYLRMRKITSVMSTQDVTQDFPDLRYPPGFQVLAGMLVVPLSVGGNDFIAFFRKGQLREVKWAGNPYEKFIKEGTEGYLEPRKSFKMWRETVIGKSREWTEEEIETAAVLCLVYGKFIEVWRQKEAALQSSQLTRLLLANSAHEVRTPLNAIINYLEIALEGTLDQETRENLAKSHSASKSLIYVINDLLDLTKTEEGGPLIKGEVFDLEATLHEATDMFQGDARRKGITYDVVKHPDLPQTVIGDQRRIRQAISNIVANAFQFTSQGSIKVEMFVASYSSKEHVNIEVACTDTGAGMSSRMLDQLFRDLEQVQSEPASMLEDAIVPSQKALPEGKEKSSLGLGLAVVARIIKNMNGQLRLKSEEGKGSRFVMQLPFDLPDSEVKDRPTPSDSEGSITPQPEGPQVGEERMLVAPDLQRQSPDISTTLERRHSAESLNSKASMRSLKSQSSKASQRSDVDRLIEAIQEPHLVEKRPKIGERSMSSRSATKPTLSKKSSLEEGLDSTRNRRSRSLEADDGAIVSPHKRSVHSDIPGEVPVRDSSTSLKALKVPDEVDTPPKTGIVGEIFDTPDSPTTSSDPLTADHMRVLVAEDDPVNSKIIKKRLEKLEHSVVLTVNGEECAAAFGDKPRNFDVVLMDMQMPIVDGLTSTKMIRSTEKTNSSSKIHSKRAALNGRIPIIAVSASLVEKERQTYIDAGFDGWILKPISFTRLGELMGAIVDTDLREKCLYQSGQWERGGWFYRSKDFPEPITAPSGQIPRGAPLEETKMTASSEGTTAEGSAEANQGLRRPSLAEQSTVKGKGKRVSFHAKEDEAEAEAEAAASEEA